MKFFNNVDILFKIITAIIEPVSEGSRIPCKPLRITNLTTATLDNLSSTLQNSTTTSSINKTEPNRSCHSGIKPDVRLNKESVYGLTDDVDELILEIYKDNNKIHSTHHYDFERVVRKVFQGIGYLVTPTKQTRDGGYDMVLETSGIVPTKHLVECKMRKSATVGIELIERLLFKVNDLKASGGVMVTNSKFSRDVIKSYATKAYQYYLKLIDGNELLNMIKYHVAKFFGFSLLQKTTQTA